MVNVKDAEQIQVTIISLAILHLSSLTDSGLETCLNGRDGSGGTTTLTNHEEQSVGLFLL